ncbi:MAG: sensor histidine kinase [Pleurocapsa minor GSE-CHR-MK-17-07R]|nr:sensor histidine kinase [Pleurocapsa minor GSE-CHR-MK 17-07R]
MHRSSPALEPGVLSISRWFYGLMFILLTLGLFSPAPVPDYFSLVIWALCGLLSAYLLVGGLTRRMGRLYLPPALLAAALTPILADSASVALYQAQNISSHDYALDGSRLYFWLILPLIVVSTQYKLRALIAFMLVTSLLPPLLTALLDVSLLPGQLTHAAVRITLYSVVGYLVLMTARAQRRQRHALAESNARLSEYASTLEQLTIARERNRLARELHDTLAHSLSAVNVQLKALEVLWEQDPAKARAALHETQELTREGLQEARRALVALRSAPVEELGLALALERLARKAAERGGLALTLNVPERIHGLTPQAEQQVYRAAEEALNNVVRHANARALALSVARAGHIVRLTVRDDGVGFDPASAARDGHFGLTGMRERATLVHGALSVDSSAGAGTTITFEVPLKEDA